MAAAHQGQQAAILVVEDELHLAEGIAENLEAEGYRAEIVGDGKSGLERILSGKFDLVILDVMLPEMDGFSVCEEVRRRGKETPILFLTAKGGVDDRIRGLQSGGDDYLSKPFHLTELLLRVQVILRRWEWYAGQGAGSDVIRFGENVFDTRTFKGRSWDGQEHSLTHKEAMILKALSERPSEVISREDLLEKVWGYDVYPSTRTIDNFILRLRKRFEPDPEQPRYFHTVWGVGYRFTPEGEKAS
ncbi:MAG: response regulator transcription factor [Acidobacteriota bacterium]|nr:MAG: response regulator transcription factor [Acidobacteriota bacterium]